MDLQVAVLEWMSERGKLSRLRQQCELYQQDDKVSCTALALDWLLLFLPQSTRVVYKFVVEVDPCELLQCNGELSQVAFKTNRSLSLSFPGSYRAAQTSQCMESFPTRMFNSIDWLCVQLLVLPYRCAIQPLQLRVGCLLCIHSVNYCSYSGCHRYPTSLGT